MPQKSKYFLLAATATILLPIMVSAEERVSHDAVKVVKTQAYSPETVMRVMQNTDYEGQGEEFYLDTNNWVLQVPLDDTFLNAKSGSDFMNLLYPSGVRLPTMILDPSDPIETTNDYSPFYVGEECTLLRLLTNNRVNFTKAEIQAAGKYYRMLQAKSIAMGLPVFSFSSEYVVKYSSDIVNIFRKYVAEFEQHFGAIGFPDTSSLDFDWCKIVSNEYNTDLTAYMIKNEKSLEYKIPTGEKTLKLFKSFWDHDVSDTSALNDLVLENTTVPEEDTMLLEKYSDDVFEAYRVACVYMPNVIDEYANTYSNITIGEQAIRPLTENYTEDLSPSVTSPDKNARLEGDKNKYSYSNDPYVQATTNQRDLPYSAKTLHGFENSDLTGRDIYHRICIFSLVIIATIVCVIKFLTHYM